MTDRTDPTEAHRCPSVFDLADEPGPETGIVRCVLWLGHHNDLDHSDNDHYSWRDEDEETAEEYLVFLVALRTLARTTHLGAFDHLPAIREGLDRAIGGDLSDATEWVDRVSMGMIGPVGEDDE